MIMVLPPTYDNDLVFFNIIMPPMPIIAEPQVTGHAIREMKPKQIPPDLFDDSVLPLRS